MKLSEVWAMSSNEDGNSDGSQDGPICGRLVRRGIVSALDRWVRKPVQWVKAIFHSKEFLLGSLRANGMYRRGAAICALMLLGASTGFSQNAVRQVRLMDYFYPVSKHAKWAYLTAKENGGYRATQVGIVSLKSKLNLFRVEDGGLVDNYKSVLNMSTSSAKYSNGEFDFDSGSRLSNDYFGLKSNYVIYGFDDIESNTMVRFSPGAVFPEKFKIKQSVSIRTGMFDAGGRRGPDATLSTQLLGMESVTVPAGTFSDCIHLRFTISFEDGPSQSADEWWAKGVGVIKRRIPKASGKPSITELHYYSVPYPVTLQFLRFLGDFGSVRYNLGDSIYGRVTRKFEVKNRGNTTIPGLTISVTGASSFTCNRTSTGKLSPGQKARFEVTFAPKEFGKHNALLLVQESGNPANFCKHNIRGVGD